MTQRLLVAVGIYAIVQGCASVPTTIHNGTSEGFTVELGGLYSPSQEISDVSSEDAEKTKQNGERSGFVGLVQQNFGYVKFDSAPLPGAWIGIGATERNPGRFAWYPSIEFTGSKNSEGGKQEDKKDGFITDKDGNRYLYEINRKSNGFGIASPQTLEIYPTRRLGVYFTMIPTYLNNSSETTVTVPYEKDSRFINADPELAAKLAEIKGAEEKRENINHYALPLMIGARATLGPFHWRLAYNYRGVDNIKNYEHTFKDVVILTFGYVSKPKQAYQPSPAPARTPPATQPQPQPQPQPGAEIRVVPDPQAPVPVKPRLTPPVPRPKPSRKP